MNKHLDLRNIPIVSASLHNEHIENELCGEISFANININKIREIIDTLESGGLCDITYRIKRMHDEDSVEEIVTKDCYINRFDSNDCSCTLGYVTSNAGMRILSVLKSKDGKDMVVQKKLADMVYKVCKPKKLSFKQLQKVVVACSI